MIDDPFSKRAPIATSVHPFVIRFRFPNVAPEPRSFLVPKLGQPQSPRPQVQSAIGYPSPWNFQQHNPREMLVQIRDHSKQGVCHRSANVQPTNNRIAGVARHIPNLAANVWAALAAISMRYVAMGHQSATTRGRSVT